MAQTRLSCLLRECAAEFVGTGLLITFGAGCVAALVVAGASFGQWEISIIWGLGVMVAIYCTAGVSGAHLNPAVTLALTAFHGFDKSKVIPFIISQFLGAFCAAALVYFLYGALFIEWEVVNNVSRSSIEGLATAGVFSTFPHPAITLGTAFLVEVVCTFLLMFGILALGDRNNGVGRASITPLLIGILIAVIGGSLGPLTGFAMNPARDFGPKLFTYLAGWDYALSGGKDIPYFLIPIFAPIVGAMLAAWAYPALFARHLVEACKDGACAIEDANK